MAQMDEQEIQAFLDRLMQETAAENNVPAEILDEAMHTSEETPEPESEPESEPDAESPSEPEPDEEPALGDIYEPEQAQKKPHPVRDAVVGVILVVLAGVGLYASVRAGIGLVQRLTAKPEDPRIQQVQETVLPLAVMDLPEFDDPDALTDDQFLTAAFWSAVTHGSLDSYPENLGMRVIPAADLTALGNDLFGTSRSPQYQSIGFSGDIRLYYDKEQGSYLVPASPRLFTYVPQVTALSGDNSALTAETAYYAEAPVWQAEQTELIKTVAFTLTQTDSGAWQVRALRQLS